MNEGNIVAFDNLIQPHSSGIVGLTQQVKAIRPLINKRSQVSAGGICYQPVDLADVSHRAQQAGREFRKIFPLRDRTCRGDL